MSEIALGARSIIAISEATIPTSIALTRATFGSATC
jgi:hypothetical protein